jgi:hypothetical protein
MNLLEVNKEYYKTRLHILQQWALLEINNNKCKAWMDLLKINSLSNFLKIFVYMLLMKKINNNNNKIKIMFYIIIWIF